MTNNLNRSKQTGKITIKLGKNIEKKVLAIAYSLKDAIAISFGGLPVRASELILIVVSFFDILKNKNHKMHRNEILLFLCLLCNLLQSFTVSILNQGSIDNSFFIKYIFRNILYSIVFFIFAIGNRVFSDYDIKYLCKTIVIINCIAFVVLYTTGYRFDLGILVSTKESSFQIMNIFGMRIPRFFGTASEAGYLAPFLMMPLYYYLSMFLKKKKHLIEIIILFIMIVLTFSAIVYFLAAMTCFFVVKKQKNLNLKKCVIVFATIILLSCIFAYLFVPEFKEFADKFFINKIVAFIGNDKGIVDYSGSDRNMHLLYCLKEFASQPIINKIFGIGTGGYSASIVGNNQLYSNAEEAYNLYASTLLDRGIIGLIIVILIIILISQYHIKQSVESSAIYMGIISQYIHWFLTGNMWLCYFWIEVLYLIGFYYWEKLRSNRQNEE